MQIVLYGQKELEHKFMDDLLIKQVRACVCLFKEKNIQWHNQDCLEEKTQECCFKIKDKPERYFEEIASKYNA